MPYGYECDNCETFVETDEAKRQGDHGNFLVSDPDGDRMIAFTLCDECRAYSLREIGPDDTDD